MGSFNHGINSFGLGSGSQASGHGSNNSKTPKEAYKRIQGIVGNHGHHSYTDSRTDPHSGDKLNDISGRHGNGAGSMERHDRHGNDRNRHEGHSQ